MERKMKWLITGGCGFIGASLIKELIIEGGHSIRVIDNLSVGTLEDLKSIANVVSLAPDQLNFENESSSIELIVGDILDFSLALKLVQNCDVVVHLAANTGVGPSVEDPEKDMMVNVCGTFNYLEASRHSSVKKFIFASSGAPIGECIPPIHEEMAPHPVSPYGASKLSGEGYCSAFFRTYGLQTITLRFGNVYGPRSGRKNSVVAKFIKNALEDRDLEIFGDGTQTRDFIFIGDLVNAIKCSAAVSDIGGEIFQIATNAETTVGELVDLLVSTLNARGFKHVKIRKTFNRKGDVMRNYSDTSKAKHYLGWSSQTNLQDGLNKTVDWFLADNKLNNQKLLG
jgi:UDP-glucose 4-epimerase